MKPHETARLRFTLWTLEDLDDAQRLWGDPEVMQHIDVRGGLDREQVAQRLRQEIERQETYGVQYWRVALKDNDEAVGCCGLRPYDLDRRVYEIGFHLMSRHWGMGYATEAARAVIQHAFKRLRIPRLFAGHHPDNTTSRAMLAKLGFKYVGDQLYAATGLQHPSYELEAP